jgi:hypothetical protein
MSGALETPSLLIAHRPNFPYTLFRMRFGFSTAIDFHIFSKDIDTTQTKK